MNIYTKSITHYCEISGDHFFSEPLNLVSNIAFVIAALMLSRNFKNHSDKCNNRLYNILPILVLLVGIGSFMWHSLRTPFAHAMDFVPIFAFFILYIYLFFTELLNHKKFVVLGTMAFIILQILVSFFFPQILNGSIRHVVNVGLFLAFLPLVKTHFGTIPKEMYMTILVYAVATFFRTLDKYICPGFPIGTHFLWHILTAASFYYAGMLLGKLHKLTNTGVTN